MYLPDNMKQIRTRRGRDRMVAGFTTTYAISVYPGKSSIWHPHLKKNLNPG